MKINICFHKWEYDSYYSYEVYRQCSKCKKLQRWSIKELKWVSA